MSKKPKKNRKNLKKKLYQKTREEKKIYLDYASAAPIDIKVKKAMDASLEYFANASAIHEDGLLARQVIEDSRLNIAKLINAHTDEIIFTGSGTESAALAILGVVRSNKRKLPHIITSSIEHPAVLSNCRMLESTGEAEVTYIEPNEKGIINPKEVEKNIKENTVLVSIMYANNEIGTIEPIQEIAKVIRHYRKNNESVFPIFHSDACQAMNYLMTENIEKLGVDLLTFNSSKIYGPKGIAVLFKKRKVEITPLYEGGGQEFGLRSGTENVSLIVGLSEALEEIKKIKDKEYKRLTQLRDYGINKLLSLSKITGYEIILNGDVDNRLPNNINISIMDFSSELLVIELDARGIEISSKSSCKSEDSEESHVISSIRKAKGVKSDSTDGSLRISLGRKTNKGDIDYLISSLKEILLKYKEYKAWK